MKFRRGRGIYRTHKLLKSWTVQMFWKFLSVNREGGFDFQCPTFFLLITRLYKNHNLNGLELIHQIRVHGFNQPKYMMHNVILLIEANFKIKPRFDFFQLYLCLLYISNLMEWCIWQHISMKHAHLLLIWLQLSLFTTWIGLVLALPIVLVYSYTNKASFLFKLLIV